MSNAKKKGDAREKQVQKILEGQGRLVLPAQRTMKPIYTPKGVRYISQANDFYGLFDGMYRQDNRAIVWYQVKSDMSDVYKAKKAICEWMNNYANFTLEHAEVWMYVYRKGYRVWTYIPVKDEWLESFINFKGISIDTL